MEQHGPWKTLKSTKVHSSPWIEVSEHDVISPGQEQRKYSTVHFRNHAIGILPLDENLNTWIVGQYRYPIKAYTWEIPEGGGPLGIAPLESAQRELKEETGIIAEQWDLILRFHTSNSATDESGHLYIARELSFHDPEPDEDEALELRKIPLDELYNKVLDGEIQDSLTIMATLRAKLMLAEGRL